MSNLNAQGYGASPIDTGATTINTTSAWVQVGGAPITMGGGKTGALLTIITGSAGAIAHLKLTRTESIGGTHVDWLVDTDFNTATDEMIDCITGSTPPNIYQLALSSRGQVKLAELRGVGEIGIWAKKATADVTLQVLGTMF